MEKSIGLIGQSVVIHPVGLENVFDKKRDLNSEEWG